MKLLKIVERILWATQMDSLTSPASWTRRGHSDDLAPWITSLREDASPQRSREDGDSANA